MRGKAKGLPPADPPRMPGLEETPAPQTGPGKEEKESPPHPPGPPAVSSVPRALFRGDLAPPSQEGGAGDGKGGRRRAPESRRTLLSHSTGDQGEAWGGWGGCAGAGLEAAACCPGRAGVGPSRLRVRCGVLWASGQAGRVRQAQICWWVPGHHGCCGRRRGWGGRAQAPPPEAKCWLPGGAASRSVWRKGQWELPEL